MAQNPNPSLLDPGQCIKRAFDGTNDRIRVDAEITAEIGSSEVIISETDDSILIYGNDGSTNRKIKTDSDGNLQVDVLSVSDGGNSITVDGSVSVIEPSDYEEILQYNEVSSVAAASETTVLTYTVPLAKTFHLHQISVSGTNLGSFKVKVNGNVKAQKRTWWTKFNEDFSFLTPSNKGFEVPAGDIITVTVLHNSSTVGDFNASILGLTTN
jgi:hypothetical protein